jgi:tetratricopeptide (TPR) repeat protein
MGSLCGLTLLGVGLWMAAVTPGDTLRHGDPGPVGSGAGSPPRPMEEGDSLYALGRFAEARQRYEGPGADTFPALWRLARVESDMAEDAKGDERKQRIASAERHARAAIRVAPDSALGHEWLAVVLGRKALKEGPKSKLSMAREIKSEVDRALELNPNSARAYHVRGRWNRELASLNAMERLAANTVLGGVPKGASTANADEAFQKAIALEPDYINHRLEYGRLLLQLKRPDDARRELEKAIALPPTSSALDPRFQAEARELLDKLPKK